MLQNKTPIMHACFRLCIAEQNYDILSLEGTETISQPYRFDVDILVPRTHFTDSPDCFLSQVAKLTISTAVYAQTRTLTGVITATEIYGLHCDGRIKYGLRIEPSLAYCALQSGPRIFLQRSIPEIITQVLEQAGYHKQQLHFNLTQAVSKHDYIAQIPTETDLDFLARLLAHAGIHYVASDNGDLYFADNNHYFQYAISSPLEYNPSHGLSSPDPSCIFSLQATARTTTEDYHISDCHETQPDQLLQNEPVLGNPLTQATFASGINSQQQAQQQARLYREYMQTQVFQLSAKSNIAQLSCGKLIHLNAPQTSYSGVYIIDTIKHSLRQNTDSFDHDTLYHYHNEMCLIPSSIPYRAKPTAMPRFPYLFTAQIESNSQYAHLDKLGCYKIKFNFDLQTHTPTTASHWVPRLYPYLDTTDNKNKAWHTPLLHGCEVIIACLHGNPDRPMIFASLPNAENSSPITANNNTLNRWRSNGDNEIQLDDKHNNEAILLRTAANLNHIELRNATGTGKITLTSSQGKIIWQAGQTIQASSGNNTQLKTQKSLRHSSQHSTWHKAKQGDLHWQTKYKAALYSKRNMTLEARNNIEINSAKAHNLIAKQLATITVLNKNLLLHSQQGSSHLQAGRTLHLRSQGKGTLNIQQGYAGIHIAANGVVTLSAKHIHVQNPQSMQLLGNVTKVSKINNPQSIHIPKLPILHQIAMLAANNNSLQLASGSLFIDINFDAKQTGAASINYLEETHYEILLDTNAGESPPTVIHTGAVKNSRIHVLPIDLSQPLLLRFTGNKDNQVLFTSAIDNKPIKPHLYDKLTIDSHTNEKKLTLTVLFPVIIFNFRVETISAFEKLLQQEGLRLSTQEKTNLQQTLHYFTSLPKKFWRYRRTRLTREEIAYLKNNGNNATLFIHGYNVPFGRFNKDIIPSKYKNGQVRVVQYGQEDCSLLRSLELMQARYPHAINLPLQKQDSKYNGFGAHNWWLWMEDNLNRASKQFKHTNYQDYTRLIHISWQGDTSEEADYMAAVRMAQYPAKLVACLVEQLYREGIHVNIVAHSLGNQVLMHTLEELGRRGLPPGSIAQLIMWQAAVPNNVFVPRQQHYDPEGLYYFKHAYKMAKKIMVLYSHQDNVLGPLPDYDLAKLAYLLQKKAADPTAGISMVAVASAMHLMRLWQMPNHLRSIYSIANLFQRPFTYILEGSDERQSFYQDWLNEHPLNTSDKSHQLSLREQTHYFSKQHRVAFNCLSYILGSYITHRSHTDVHNASTTRDESLADEDKLVPWSPYLEEIRQFMRQTPKNYSVILGLGLIKINNPRKIGAAVKNAAHTLSGLTESTLHIPQDFLHGNWDSTHASQYHRAGNELAAIIFTIITSKDIVVPPALGYAGPDSETQALLGDRLEASNQKECLVSHSGMKHPKPLLMHHIYQKTIFANENFKFGRYKQ